MNTQYQDQQSYEYNTAVHGIAQSNNTRLICDLEFIDLLTHPTYICFTLHRYYKQKTFQNYLHYLSYLRAPDYIVLVQNPVGLYILTLLQNDSFRNHLSEATEEQRVMFLQFLEMQTVMYFQSTASRSPDDLLELYAAYMRKKEEEKENAANSSPPQQNDTLGGVGKDEKKKQ